MRLVIATIVLVASSLGAAVSCVSVFSTQRLLLVYDETK